MNSSRRLSIVGSIVLLVIAIRRGTSDDGQSQQPGESPAEATRRIVSAATALMASLDDTSRAKVQFPFSGSQRERWSNFPSGIFQRQGLRLADLTPSQNAAVMTVLQAALRGLVFRRSSTSWKATTFFAGQAAVMVPAAADAVVHRLETNRRAMPVRLGRCRSRSRRTRRRGRLRQGRGLPRLRRHAVGDRALDAAVRGAQFAINLTMGGGQASMTPSCRRRSRRPTPSRDGRFVRSVRRTTNRLR